MLNYQVAKKFLLITLTLSLNFLSAGLPAEAKARVAPYLMPKDHPIKPALDALFSNSRAIFSEKSMKKAGFTNWTPRQFTRLIVSRHPDFPGYIFKMYLDTQRYYMSLPEWELWSLRVEGANLIREEVEALNLHDVFKVPHKWVYELPRHPKVPKGYVTKYYILVQEDMDLLSDKDNKDKWKSDQVTPELLTLLHHVLNKFELYDCAKVDNIPFGKDGRIAFIDTQSFYKGDVNWESLNDNLSSPNQKIWKDLTQKQ